MTLAAGNITTNSTSLIDLTGATVTFTTGANPVQCRFTASVSNDGLNNATYFNINVDGALQLGTAGFTFDEPVIGDVMNASFSFQTAALSAGSHTIKIQWKVSGGTSTALANSATKLHFSCSEIV